MSFWGLGWAFDSPPIETPLHGLPTRNRLFADQICREDTRRTLTINIIDFIQQIAVTACYAKAGGSLSRHDTTIKFVGPPVTPAGFTLPGAIDHNAANLNFAPESN